MIQNEQDAELSRWMESSRIVQQVVVPDSISEKLDKILYQLQVISTILTQDRADRLAEEMVRDATSEELENVGKRIDKS